MSRTNTHIDMEDILGTNSPIGTGDTGISFVRLQNIISKDSLYEVMKNKLVGDTYRKRLVSNLESNSYIDINKL